MKKFSDLTYADLFKLEEDYIIKLAIDEIEEYFETIENPEMKRELIMTLWHLRSEVKKLPTILNKITMIKSYILTLRYALNSRGM